MESIKEIKLKDKRLDYSILDKNAYIHLIVGRQTYNTEKQSIIFDLILSHIYSKCDKNKSSAPKGYTRELLCKLLIKLIDKNIIKSSSVILLEAEPSLKEKLLEMYKNMGFKIKEYIDKTLYSEFNNNKFKEYSNGAVMTATVNKIIEWCSDKYKIINKTKRAKGKFKYNKKKKNKKRTIKYSS